MAAKRFRPAICLAVALSVTPELSLHAGEAPLAEAVKRQNRQLVDDLLKKRADVNAAQPDGTTALHWAVFHEDLETTGLLLRAGARVDARNRYGVPPLSLACRNGNPAIVKALLEAGADANALLRGGETVLMTASRTGRLGPVRALLSHGAKLNATDRRQQTAIMWAAADGHADVVNELIRAKADFRTPLPSGFTPFFFAVREGRTAVAERLLKAGIDVNGVMQVEKRTANGPRKGTSGLILAVENGHFELAASLLKAGADATDGRCGFTVLHAVTWVRKPLRGDGDPPPIGSGKLSSLDFVRKLVEQGADVNARHRQQKPNGDRLNRTDATPFLLAAETADLPLMKLLVELGADPLLANADRSTPLLAAAGVGVLGNGDESAGTEAEAIEAVRLLLKLGADINAVDSRGNSAMHGAAYKSWTKLVQFLADSGADMKIWNRRNRRGWTPLMIAQGHRPGNFRPSAETIAAVKRVMNTTDGD